MKMGRALLPCMSVTRLPTQFSTLPVHSPIQSAPPPSATLAKSAAFWGSLSLRLCDWSRAVEYGSEKKRTPMKGFWPFFHGARAGGASSVLPVAAPLVLRDSVVGVAGVTDGPGKGGGAIHETASKPAPTAGQDAMRMEV